MGGREKKNTTEPYQDFLTQYPEADPRLIREKIDAVEKHVEWAQDVLEQAHGAVVRHVDWAKLTTRKGPDAHDDEDWSKLPRERQQYLLIAGDANDKMRDYMAQIGRKPTKDRSQAEHWTLLTRTIQDIKGEAPPLSCELFKLEAPVSWIPFAIWGAVVTLVCLALLLIMSWQRGWRQPFGPLPPGGPTRHWLPYTIWAVLATVALAAVLLYASYKKNWGVPLI